MKKLLTIAITALSVTTFAQTAPISKPSTNTTAIGNPYRSPRAGIVMCKGKGSAIVVADFRKTPTDLSETVAKISKFISSYVEVRHIPIEGDAIKSAFSERDKEGVAAVIALADEGTGSPSLSVFPENRVAVINVGRLKEGADEALLTARINKEVWRGVAFALGGYASEHPCALKTVNSLEDLDKNCLSMTCPPVNFKAADSARKFGVAPYGPVPYGIAVKRGLAPAPTNDIQKAVWDRVMADMANATNAPSATPPAK